MTEAGKQPHILLVDDDSDILRIFCGWLSHEGFEMLTAHDGNEGRETARRLQPELILLDVNMPVQDGYKTLQYLKHEKETAHIPVIFLTNEDFSIEAQKVWKEMGASGYIPKSESHEVILKKIKEVLAQQSQAT